MAFFWYKSLFVTLTTLRYVSAVVLSALWIGVIILCSAPYQNTDPKILLVILSEEQVKFQALTIVAPSFCGLAGNVLLLKFFWKTFLFNALAFGARLWNGKAVKYFQLVIIFLAR